MSRTNVRLVCVGVALTALMASTGCGSIGSAPSTQPSNPLVPANTARDTINKANAAAKALQDQVDQGTKP
jgi:uncharacterized protein YceK